MIAAVEAWRAGLFGRGHWAHNIVAGVIVGVVALPLAMAFAIASGVKPEQGLYTSIIAGVAVALLGGSRIQIAGPTGAFIVILAGVELITKAASSNHRGIDLLANERVLDRRDAGDPQGVLRGQRGNRAQAMHAVRGESLEVGLDTGAAA